MNVRHIGGKFYAVTDLNEMIVFVLLLLMSACLTVAILNTNQFVTLHQNITELILQNTRHTRNIQKHFFLLYEQFVYQFQTFVTLFLS